MAVTKTAPTVSGSIVAAGVDLAYGAEVVVRGASFSCRSGTVTAIVGPNGAGKSTLLHAMAGLLPVRSGELRVLGHSPAEVRRRISYVLQATRVEEHLPITVHEVVMMARYAHSGLLGRLGSADHEAVEIAMERVGVTRLADRRLDELSGGERQRVLVAQGLAQEGEVLLLDEPLTGLDLVTRRLLFEVLRAERDAGRTVVMTTHNLGEAKQWEQLVLLAGEVIAAGPAPEVLVTANLRQAYGDRLLEVGGEVVVLDDAHHHPSDRRRP